MKKTSIATASGILLSLALSVNVMAGTTVTVWVNGGEDAYLPTTLPYYQETHPDTDFELLYVPQGECFQKIMTTIASGGELPDIVDVNLDDFGAIREMDLWEDLTKDPYNLDTSLLIPYVLPTIQNEEGETVALMADMTTCAVAYDRNLAKEYLGTDDPEEIRAMFTSNEDYINIGKEITEKSNGTVFLFAAAQDAFNMVYAECVEEAFVDEGKLNIDDSIGKCFEFIEQLYQNGSIDLYEQWSSEWVANISNENTLFYACPMWFTNWGLVSNDSLGGGRWGLINPPSGSTQGGELFLIPRTSEDDKKEAAFDFLNWMCTTQEGAEGFHKATFGLLSAYIGNLDETNTYYKTSDENFGGQNVVGQFVKVANMDTTRIRPLTEYDSTVFNSAVAQLPGLVQGVTAADALQACKDNILSQYPELTAE